MGSKGLRTHMHSCFHEPVNRPLLEKHWDTWVRAPFDSLTEKA